MEQRAQVSLEYLVILAVALAVLGATIYVLMSGYSPESARSSLFHLQDMINNSL